jgi:hypothetical protein
MRTNNDRMKELIASPGRLKLDDIHKLADLFDYDFNKLLQLIINSFEPKIKNPGHIAGTYTRTRGFQSTRQTY